MRAIVITNKMLRKELLEFSPSENIQLSFIEEPSEYPSGVRPDVCIDLLFDYTEQRTEWLRALDLSLVVVNAVEAPLSCIDATFVRINGWPGFLNRPVMEASAVSEKARGKAGQLFSLLGRQTEWVPDIEGFVSARVVACIINEAFFALEEKISTREEIDTAMKLGTNYPFGPFEWAEKIGFGAIYSLLNRLGKTQPRYWPSKMLEGKALA